MIALHSFGFGGHILAGTILFLAGSALGAAETNQVLSKIYRVRDGARIVYATGSTNTLRREKLTLTAPGRLQFSFAPKDETSLEPLRLRFKLEGRDLEWREAGGQVKLQVITLTDSGDVLSCHGFQMAGESEGWQGSLEKSRFQLRRESVTLPAEAERLEVLLIVEHWEVLGIAAITGFRVLRKGASGMEENIWPDPKIDEGNYLSSPEQAQPRYWNRTPLGARMAQVVKLAPPMQGHALVLMDDELHVSPSWQSDFRLAGKAQGGDKLTLEWQEAFSVGAGGRNHVIYDSLPPGNYTFRVQTLTPWGDPKGSEAVLAITVPEVFWKRRAVVALGSAAISLAIALSIRTVMRRRFQAQLEQLERRRRIERERLRIAQDIHDDLGASLTHISLLTQTAHGKIEPLHPAWEETRRVSELTLNLTQKLDEIVWAVSPRHDTIEGLVSYLTDLSEDFLGAAGIRTRVLIPMKLPGWMLSPGLRHNVFLATKECLNNIVKHAKATEVRLELTVLPEAFQLSIQDNGTGFSGGDSAPQSPPNGKRSGRHGLGGVKHRVEDLGGSFSIDSAQGRGTRIVIMMPVNAVIS